jgi:hypothetical protein
MATNRLPALDDDAPSLDPSAIERAYALERTRRRIRSNRRTEVRSSNARFWFAWHQVQTTFGV